MKTKDLKRKDIDRVERSNSKGNIALDASPKLSIRVSFKSNKGLPMQNDVILR